MIVQVNKNIMTITINLDERLGLSKSKRSMLIDSTRGCECVSDHSGLKKHKSVYFSLNCYTYEGAERKKRTWKEYNKPVIKEPVTAEISNKSESVPF